MEKDIEQIKDFITHFITHSGMIGDDGLLNDSCFPEKKYFTHESWSASPRFPHEGWYCRTSDGANPNCMSYGFAIVELINLAKENGNTEYIEKAKRLADYVISFQITESSRPTYGGFGTGELLNDSAHQLPMSLIWLYKETGCEKYKDSALLCLDNYILNHHFQRDNSGRLTGVFYDYYSEERARFESWGQPGRCAHSPLCFAFSLFAGYELTGNEEHLLAVKKAYDWLMESYSGECLAAYNGIIIAPEGEGDKITGFAEKQTVPRYAGYIAHTLLGVYNYTGEKKYLDEAIKCAELILPCQRQDGTFPLAQELEQYFPNTQNGAYGYLGGVLHLLYQATGNEKYEDVAIKAVSALKLDQIINPKMKNQYGGIVRRGGASVLEGITQPFGYGFTVDVFQTLLNLQGVNMLLDRQNYIGLHSSTFSFK